MSEYTHNQLVWYHNSRSTINQDPLKAIFVKYNTKTVKIRVCPSHGAPYTKNVHISCISPREGVKQ